MMLFRGGGEIVVRRIQGSVWERVKGVLKTILYYVVFLVKLPVALIKAVFSIQ